MELSAAPDLPLVVGLPFLLLIGATALAVGIFWALRKVRLP
jgi:hypothetical protein